MSEVRFLVKRLQQCSNKCDNNNTYCSAWQRRGECKKNPEYMDIYCRKVRSMHDWSNKLITFNLGL